MRVECLEGAGGHDPQHHQVEGQPGDQVGSLPAAETVTGQTDKVNIENLFLFLIPSLLTAALCTLTCYTWLRWWRISRRLLHKESCSLCPQFDQLKPSLYEIIRKLIY